MLYNSVDQAFQKLSARQGEMMMPCCVCCPKQTEYAKHSEAWNRFPASRSTVVMANRHLFFFSFRTHLTNQKFWCPLTACHFTYNICNSFRFGVRSRCSPPHAHHDTSIDGSQLVSLILSGFFLPHCLTPFSAPGHEAPTKGIA